MWRGGGWCRKLGICWQYTQPDAGCSSRSRFCDTHTETCADKFLPVTTARSRNGGYDRTKGGQQQQLLLSADILLLFRGSFFPRGSSQNDSEVIFHNQQQHQHTDIKLHRYFQPVEPQTKYTSFWFNFKKRTLPLNVTIC